MEAVQGVTEQATDAQVVEGASQPSEEVSATEQAVDAGEEKLPFGKHPRWQKMVEENRTYKKEMARLQSDFEASKDAIEFKKLLEQHPDKHEKILALLKEKVAEQEAEAAQDSVEDDWSEYDPKVAKQMKMFSAAIKRLERLEGVAKQYEEMSQKEKQEALESHKEQLNDKFNDLLKKDGYIDDSGKFDEKKVRLIENAVLVELMKSAENPDFPTEKELHNAYASASESVQAFKTEGLKQVSLPKVPPTGSSSGASVVASGKKKPLSIEDMVRALETGSVPD